MRSDAKQNYSKYFKAGLGAFFGLLLSISSTASADSLRYLARGDQALMQMMDLIRSARHSIDLTYYIFDPCAVSSNIILKALQDKAKAGVRVRVVIDAMTHGSALQRQFGQLLNQDGIELRYFNKGIVPMINYRSHAKVMIADGDRYITGGRNLADDYFGLQEQNFIDRDVYVEGSSALEVQRKFNLFWADKKISESNITDDQQANVYEKICPNFELKNSEKLQAALAKETKATLASLPVAECSELTFTFDSAEFWHSGADIPQDPTLAINEEISAFKLKKKETTAAIFQFLREDVKSLVFENWSYIPTKTINWILRNLRDEKIPILVVTNRTTDVGGPVDVLNKHYSARDNKGSQRIIGLSKLGSMDHSWSQTPAGAKWMIHSKVFVANLNHVAVTSFNIDPRSVHTNIETGLFVRSCPKFADVVLKETGILVDNFEKDKLCKTCQINPKDSFLSILKAWVGHELM